MTGPPVPVVQASGLGHTYELDGLTVPSLVGVDLEVAEGETVALLGASGSGKSTLLGLLGGLQRPRDGRLVVLDRDLRTASERALLAMRARDLGVVFQSPGRNVLGHAGALDNLLFAQRAGGRSRAERRRRGHELLARVGLGDRAHTRAGAMSGGEQQRLAVAVGLANGPRLLLADEPTSQLDHASGAGVVRLLMAARNTGCAVVVVTHDPDVAAQTDRVLTMADGALVDRRRTWR